MLGIQNVSLKGFVSMPFKKSPLQKRTSLVNFGLMQDTVSFTGAKKTKKEKAEEFSAVEAEVKLAQTLEHVKKQSAKLKAEVAEVKKQSIKHYQEVSEIIKKAKENDYEDINDESTGTMIHFSDSQTPYIASRTSKAVEEFRGGRIVRRAEFIPETGFIRSIYLNYEQIDSETYRVGKQFNYVDHCKISEYRQGSKRNKSGKCKEDHAIIFNEGKLFMADYDFKKKKDGSTTQRESYEFDSEGKITTFISNSKNRPDGGWIADEFCEFQEGIINDYGINYGRPWHGCYVGDWFSAFVKNGIVTLEKIS